MALKKMKNAFTKRMKFNTREFKIVKLYEFGAKNRAIAAQIFIMNRGLSNLC